MFTAAPNWKHSNGPSAGDWLNKLWSVHFGDRHNSAGKRDLTQLQRDKGFVRILHLHIAFASKT